MASILIVAKGTYGDIFPLYAIALELQRRGHDLLFATDSHNAVAAAEMGLKIALFDVPPPSGETPVRPNGMFDALFDRLLSTSNYLRMFRKETIEREYANLLPLAREADVVIGNQQAYSAAVVREALGAPWIYCAASPVALLTSYRQSALFPGVHRLQAISMDSLLLQRFAIGLGRTLSRTSMRNVTKKRQSLGLPSKRHPAFEAMFSERLNLLLASPLLFDPEQEWPEATRLTGYAWFEAGFMRDDGKAAELDAFLRAGPPPVVFTLGGNRRIHPGSYFHESIEACRLLDLRCIIVAAKRFHDTIPQSDAVLVTGYLPYAKLFRHAAAVVHSGGIGTIGLTLRYGIPSLLIPYSLDQFDNAHHAVRHGFAKSMPIRKYRAAHVADALDGLLKDGKLLARLQTAAETVAAEDGTKSACDAIEETLGRPEQNA